MTAGGDQQENLGASPSPGAGGLSEDRLAAAAEAYEALQAAPRSAANLRQLAATLRTLGRDKEAEAVDIEAIQASADDPVLVASAQAIRGGQWREAEHLLRPHLRDHPQDAAAINMLGQIAAKMAANKEAERLFREAIALAPRFAAARIKLAELLVEQSRRGEAIAVLDELLRFEPHHFRARIAKASSLAATGEYEEALRLYRTLLREFPERAALWMSAGHVLKTMGRLEEGIASYRRAIELDPALGEAWWSLANLKTVQFDERDIADLKTVLEVTEDASRRLHLHFALGKAFEDLGDYETSFGHYADGNQIRRTMLPYDRGATTDLVERSISLFSPAFFEKRRGTGSDAEDPIFILGMPRAGSTLLEQILASHSMVEGTSELPYIPILAREFVSELWRSPGASYPEVLADLDAETLARLGRSYLERAAAHRKTGRPLFIDKLPNNWIDIGFIHLILPNARIIDARRHPLACCFSNFKQHFARGQPFAYSLEDLGHYYSDYVRLTAHFDDVMPGRIHRVIHEELVEDPDGEIRRLLEALGLPFEDQCLRFYDNARPVRTPSAEQVRRPIDPSGLDRWKHYEPWLTPLKTALGALPDFYPAQPPS